MRSEVFERRDASVCKCLLKLENFLRRQWIQSKSPALHPTQTFATWAHGWATHPPFSQDLSFIFDALPALREAQSAASTDLTDLSGLGCSRCCVDVQKVHPKIQNVYHLLLLLHHRFLRGYSKNQVYLLHHLWQQTAWHGL